MDRTLLLGLDGATFSILDPLMRDGTMPFLRQLAAGGARAELLSTLNPLTPPAWVSMTTGRSPGHHGVFDFIWAEERQGQVYFTLNTFRDIMCETIWSLVSRQQGTVCALNFPILSPPPTVAGVIVPGLVSWRHLRRNIHPRGAFERLQAIPGFDPKAMAWDFDLEKQVETGVPEDQYEQFITFHIRRERQWFEVLRTLMRDRPADLTAIVFDGVDKLQHIGWRFLDPACAPAAPSEWERRLRALCLDYFRQLDGFLADIVSLAGPNARVFIASDHGFGPTRDVFRLNTWLHSRGYLTWKDVNTADEKAKESITRLIERHFVLLEWDRTTAYARTTTSNGIYIRVANRLGETGVPAADYPRFRDQLSAELRSIRHPVTGRPIIRDVLPREAAFPGRQNGRAPDLTLVLWDHGFASIRDRSPIICPRPVVEGTHYPEGVFLAAGPGIRSGADLGQLSILDVAPCLLRSLGVPVPEDLEGQVPGGLFDAVFSAARPTERGVPTLAPATAGVPDEASALTVEEEETVFRQLRALGYIE